MGSRYNHRVASSTGTPPGRFAITAGVLPPGLTLTGAGILAGTPTEAGSFIFTITASNGLFPDASAQFTVPIARANTAPVARGDGYMTREGSPVSVATPGVLGDDRDGEHDPLTAVRVTGPAHGSLRLNANGSFRFTPARGSPAPTASPIGPATVSSPRVQRR